METDPLSTIRQLGRTCFYSAGRQIYAKGTPAGRVFIALSGEAITVSTGFDGREVVFYRMDNSYGVAPLTALLGDVTYQHDCIAYSDCELRVIDTQEVIGVVRKDPDLALHLLNLSLRLLIRRTQQWEDGALLSTGARVAKWLLEHTKKCSFTGSSIIELRETARMIGLALGGVSRESVSRSLTELDRAGIIRKYEKTVWILDRRKLEAFASGSEVLAGRCDTNRDAGRGRSSEKEGRDLRGGARPVEPHSQTTRTA